MRRLAGFVVESNPNIVAICEIEPGDALSLATRFALQWAYRGRQALFWNARFFARDVHDLYLPLRAGRPFDRRGFVRVDGNLETRACTLVATQFSAERDARTAELRFARTQVRGGAPEAMFFALVPERSTALAGLGFRDVTPDAESAGRVLVRGFEDVPIRVSLVTV